MSSNFIDNVYEFFDYLRTKAGEKSFELVDQSWFLRAGWSELVDQD